jgi:SagB-type dehydrogenase family enzyme
MVDSAREYHFQTGYGRYDMGGGRLDWGNQPTVFKTYPGLRTVNLSEVTAWPEGDLSSLLGASPRSGPELEIDLEGLSRVLLLTHSLTAKTRYAGEDFYYRSVASAGALYPFELYVAASNVKGLEDGLYHQNVKDRALTLLRSGDVGSQLSAAVPMDQGKVPVLVFFLTCIFFRSSWKYRDRGYRYNLLDTGHLAENLCLALNAVRLPFRLVYDFDDQTVNDLLQVDIGREGCLAVCLVEMPGLAPQMETHPCRDASNDLADRSWVSTREINYPVVRDIHALSSKIVKPAADAGPMINNLGLKPKDWQKLDPPADSPMLMGYAESVFRRRSMRNFVKGRLPSDALKEFLRLLAADFREQDLLSVGFLAGNVEGLEPGFYVADPRNASIGLVSSGSMMDRMASACLGQAWLANCSLHFLFVTNLALVEITAGPRGYRRAMLAAGRLGQRIYLAATSMRMGCCGIGAFYDEEASDLLGLNDDSVLLYLVGAGLVKRWPTK